MLSKGFFSEVTLWVVPGTSKKRLNQLNVSQKIEEHQKLKIHKNREKITQSSSPWGGAAHGKVILCIRTTNLLRYCKFETVINEVVICF